MMRWQEGNSRDVAKAETALSDGQGRFNALVLQKNVFNLAPAVGLEPTTQWLTATCSAD